MKQKNIPSILSKHDGANLGLNLAIKLFEKPELYFINSKIGGTKSSQQEQERGLTWAWKQLNGFVWKNRNTGEGSHLKSLLRLNANNIKAPASLAIEVHRRAQNLTSNSLAQI